MNRERIVIIGGGGHARVVADVIEATGMYQIVGYTSPDAKDRIDGIARLGGDDVLQRVFTEGTGYVALGIGDNALRKTLAAHAGQLGFALPAVVHPSAVVSPRATIGPGTVVMPGAIVNTGTSIGCGTILNTAASVDHDCHIGDFVHIAPGCHLAGTVTIDEGAFLGIGTSVIPNRHIGAWAVVGAGAAVVTNIADASLATGVPARARKR